MGIAVEEIEKVVAELQPNQLRRFRSWYEKFDSDAWDRQIENDIATGKLDALAKTALADHKAGKTRQL